MRNVLILVCVAPLAASVAWPSRAQSYNYAPVVPPTYYAPPPFIPAQPIPMVPMPSFNPPPMLPYGVPAQPYQQQEDDDAD